MIKLILADIDNTLVPLGHTAVSERTLAAIHVCQQAGLVFAPASGRSLVEVAAFLDHDETAYRTAVLVNGQQVYLRGRLVSEITLDDEALEYAESIIRGRRGCALLIYRPDGFCDWVGDDPERLGSFTVNAMHHGSQRHATLPHYPVVKAGIVTLVDHAVEQAIMQELSELCPQLDFLGNGSGWSDVVPSGWNKVRGIEVLERELGVTPEQICVFGDAENDLPMFAHVTHSCAVANARPAALQAARWKVGASAADGVAIALEQIAQAAREAQETGADVLPAFMRTAEGR